MAGDQRAFARLQSKLERKRARSPLMRATEALRDLEEHASTEADNGRLSRQMANAVISAAETAALAIEAGASTLDAAWADAEAALPQGWWIVGVFRLIPTGNFAAIAKPSNGRGLDYDGPDSEIRGIGLDRVAAMRQLADILRAKADHHAEPVEGPLGVLLCGICGKPVRTAAGGQHAIHAVP